MKISLAMITGASSGIGTALCRLLADKGVRLLITGRDQERLETLASELRSKIEVMVFPADLTNLSDRAGLIKKMRLHHPDLVINNAGFGLYGDALSHPTANQLAIFDVNAASVLELTLEAARIMKDNAIKGTILNVSSAAGFLVFPSMSVYAASKSFVNQVSEALDIELERFGIRVLAACPGMVDTHFRERAGGVSQPPRKNVMTASFAAEQIWWQIQQRKPLYVFDWKYRVGLFLARFVPKKWLAKLLRKEIEERRAPQGNKN